MRPTTILPPASLLAIGLWLALAGVASAETAAGRTVDAGDDGWRRTADGWEHISAWQAPAAVSRSSTTDSAEVAPAIALGCIVAGIAGGLALLLIEIDPVEYHAFRLRSRGREIDRKN